MEVDSGQWRVRALATLVATSADAAGAPCSFQKGQRPWLTSREKANRVAVATCVEASGIAGRKMSFGRSQASSAPRWFKKSPVERAAPELEPSLAKAALTQVLRHRTPIKEIQLGLSSPRSKAQRQQVPSDHAAARRPDSAQTPPQLSSTIWRAQQYTIGSVRAAPPDCPLALEVIEPSVLSPKLPDRPGSAPSGQRSARARAAAYNIAKRLLAESEQAVDLGSIQLAGISALSTQQVGPQPTGQQLLPAAAHETSTASTPAPSARRPSVPACGRGGRSVPATPMAPSGFAKASHTPHSGRGVVQVGRRGSVSKPGKANRLILPFAYADDDPRVAHMEALEGQQLPQFRADGSAGGS